MEQQLKAHLSADIVKVAPAKLQEQKKTLVNIGKIIPKPGQRVWQLCMKTLQITDVTPERTEATLNGKLANKKLECLKGHIYCMAINFKNAETKFKIRIDEMIAAEKKKRNAA